MDSVTDWIMAVSSAALAVFGFWQIPLFRKRAREIESLRACQLYDTDAVIELASSRAWKAVKAGTAEEDYGLADQRDIIVVMNYFDGLAIGIEQGLYDEKIIRDYSLPMVRKLISKIAPKVGLNADLYPKLFALYSSWENNRTHYKARWWT